MIKFALRRLLFSKESANAVVGSLVLSVCLFCFDLVGSLFDVLVEKLKNFVLNRYDWHMSSMAAWGLILFASCSVLPGLLGGIDQAPRNQSFPIEG